jgi:hypothetical protein
LLSSCGKSVESDSQVSEIDTTLYRSEQTTERYSIIVYEVDSFEDVMWYKVGHKIDSLILRNKELEKKQGRKPTLPRVRVQDATGAIRDYGNLEDIKKRLLEEKEGN